MEKLTLNDGTVLENANVIRSGLDLFTYVYNSDLRSVFDLLIDPEKTARIVYTQNNGEDIVYNGFDRLTAIRDEGNGLITAVLEREVGD